MKTKNTVFKVFVRDTWWYENLDTMSTYFTKLGATVISTNEISGIIEICCNSSLIPKLSKHAGIGFVETSSRIHTHIK